MNACAICGGDLLGHITTMKKTAYKNGAIWFTTEWFVHVECKQTQAEEWKSDEWQKARWYIW